MGQKGDAMWTREHLCIQRTLVKKKKVAVKQFVFNLVGTAA